MLVPYSLYYRFPKYWISHGENDFHHLQQIQVIDMIYHSLAKVLISLSASPIIIYETLPIANTYYSLLDTRYHHYLDSIIII